MNKNTFKNRLYTVYFYTGVCMCVCVCLTLCNTTYDQLNNVAETIKPQPE